MPRVDFALSVSQRLDARAALKILDGTGIALEDAARLALAGKRSVVRTTVAAAADAFILSRVRKTTRRGKPLRAATIAWYQDFLQPLVNAFGDDYIDALDRSQFSGWLNSLQTGATSRAATARACRALWRWAALENPPLVTDNVTLGLSFTAGARPESERLVLTVAQAEAILSGADWSRSAVALMLFAGIRPEEIAGPDKPWLRWENVNISEKYIRIPAEVSKTAKPRLIEHLPPTLWRWLQPGALGATVSPYSARAIRQRAIRSSGIAAWPHDCFRHTAATYLLALRRDAGIVAEWLGHEGRPSLLHQTYRGQLTLDRTQVNHAMARAFFALSPPAIGSGARRPRRVKDTPSPTTKPTRRRDR